jgi:hypothetical protein
VVVHLKVSEKKNCSLLLQEREKEGEVLTPVS